MPESMHEKRVLYALPAADAVHADRDVAYAGDLTMDVYSPPNSARDTPAVIIVAGYPDEGFEKIVGCKFKDMGAVVSWARLIAASGLVAITYTNREPEADLHTLIEQVHSERKFGVWASSGNVPLALSLLMRDTASHVKCAALCYGYTLDVDEEAKQFRFANPCSGRSVNDLNVAVPLFLARAGRDEMPGLNEAMDTFIQGALARNLPITVVNHPAGPHAFDLLDDTESTRRIVRQILAFLQLQLLQ
jgi:hypothetical protein